MRIIVTGATGNVGTSLLQSLAREASVSEIVGIARRVPKLEVDKARFVPIDITTGELKSLFRGAQAVVHLAWLLQPSRDEAKLEKVNVEGSRRVFDAVVDAGVSQLVVASSVGAYAPGPKDRFVDESFPTTGVQSSLYSRQKVKVERMLDVLERNHSVLRVARLRPGLIFKRQAGAEVRRLFLGRLLPRRVLRSPMIRFIPETPGFKFQVVHSLDVGDAFRRAVVCGARGPFNIAADPVLDTEQLVRALRGKPIRVPAGLLRKAAALSYRLRLQPTAPGWVDLALNAPLMSVARAREQLGWQARHDARDAVRELFDGLTEGEGAPTVPLAPESGA